MEPTTENQLPTPPGYHSLIPFDKDSHKDLGLKIENRFAFASSLHAIYLSTVEFVQACRHFPIVFAGTTNGDSIVPMVVTGLKANENLFLDDKGAWAEGVYTPAYLRRYPFYTAQVKREGDAEEHMICVDPSGLTSEQPPLMDAEGKTSEQWTNLEKFIREMELARQRTQKFTSMLVKHDLLETFEAQVHNKSGAELKVGGMLRVSAEKLKNLPGKTLQSLVKDDYLFLIDLHRMSMDNFRLLLDRVTTAKTRTS